MEPFVTCTATTPRSRPCARPASACWPSTIAAGATARPLFRRRRRILADADAAWTSWSATSPTGDKRVIYGHSLGGAVAIDLASRKHGGTDYAALIVESTLHQPRRPGRAGCRVRPARWPHCCRASASIRSRRSTASTRRSSSPRRAGRHRSDLARPPAARRGAARRDVGRSARRRPQQTVRGRPRALSAHDACADRTHRRAVLSVAPDIGSIRCPASAAQSGQAKTALRSTSSSSGISRRSVPSTCVRCSTIRAAAVSPSPRSIASIKVSCSWWGQAGMPGAS